MILGKVLGGNVCFNMSLLSRGSEVPKRREQKSVEIRRKSKRPKFGSTRGQQMVFRG